MLENDVKSLIAVPLRNDSGNIDGIFEIGSPNPGELTFASLMALKEVLPLIIVAVDRIMEEMHNRIRATIKQHYTAIHPTVDWKFTQTAIDYIEKLNTDPEAELEEIVF